MQKYLPVLRNCPFFTGLTDDEILSILHCVSAAKITRPRGSYIFRAGDSTEVMGLMLSGSTLVIQEDLSAESIRQSSLSFDIPFDRQQLADFLCVERAAMSVELSKLQKEGLLVTKRNHFELLTR